MRLVIPGGLRRGISGGGQNNAECNRAGWSSASALRYSLV